MAFDVSLGLGSVVGALSSMWNVHQQKQMNAQNQAFAESQATTAFERQKELMNMQNDYNDPAAQMQRYVDAGLNPNLVYGTPNLSAGASPVATGSYGAGVAPSVDPYLLSNITGKQSEKDLNRAKAREILGDTPMSQANIVYTFNQAENLAVLTDGARYKSAVENFKYRLFNDEGGFEMTDEKGFLRNIALEMREYVYKNSIDALKAENQEYDYAIQGLTKALLGLDYDNDMKELKNEDLRKWLEVADKIYQARGDEAEVASIIAGLDKQFYNTIDMGDKGIKMIFQILTSLVRAMSALK